MASLDLGVLLDKLFFKTVGGSQDEMSGFQFLGSGSHGGVSCFPGVLWVVGFLEPWTCFKILVIFLGGGLPII